MKPEYLRRTACPICDAPLSQSDTAFKSTPAAEDVPFGRHGEFLSGYTSQRVFFSYNRCRQCKGLYCPTYFSQEQLDLLYSRQAENMAEVPLPAREATHAAYIDILEKYAVPSGDYLELGPDIGLFARLFVGTAPNLKRLYFHEPNLEVHDALRSNLDGRDIVVSPDVYREAMNPPGKVAMAVAIHVLDHLISPESLLMALSRDIAPGGLLFLVTHDERSLLARVLGRRWPPFTLQHPQLFSPHSIRILLRRCGFEMHEVAKSLNYFPIAHLIKAGLQVAGLPPITLPFARGAGIGLRLGNIATVAYRAT